MNIPAPFTENQINYYNKCFDSWFNVAEGGKRGGKNVLQTLAFCTQLEIHPNKLHLIAGVSQTTAKLNILDCDGYGLTNFFDGRCREGKYKDRSCLYIQTKTGEKIVLVSGGAKDGDEKYIKGNTYGMAYVTEANECHTKFIKEVFDRTLSSADRKIFHDLNPKAPNHWYYDEILEFHERKQKNNANYGYNYGHFTIADNLSVSDEKLRLALSQYEKGTVWYDRDILGQRKQAEGIVFKDFANNPDKYEISIDEIAPKDGNGKRHLKAYKWLDVGLDIGGNGSAYAITCSAMLKDGTLCVLKSQKKQAEDVEMAEVDKLVFDFINAVEKEYGVIINDCNCDYSDVIINTLNAKRYIFGKTYKPPLEDRPVTFSVLMNTSKFKLVKDRCEDLKEELQNLVFDDKADRTIVLDNGDMQIDTWDSLTYSCASNWHYLTD